MYFNHLVGTKRLNEIRVDLPRRDYKFVVVVVEAHVSASSSTIVKNTLTLILKL